MAGELERVDVQLQRDLPDINHINRKVAVSFVAAAASVFGGVVGIPSRRIMTSIFLRWCFVLR